MRILFNRERGVKMQDIEQEKTRVLIKEARRIACEMTGQQDFAFISKEQMALRLAELVAELARKDEEILILEAESKHRRGLSLI